jgi:hypothetical protein
MDEVNFTLINMTSIVMKDKKLVVLEGTVGEGGRRWHS